MAGLELPYFDFGAFTTQSAFLKPIASLSTLTPADTVQLPCSTRLLSGCQQVFAGSYRMETVHSVA